MKKTPFFARFLENQRALDKERLEKLTGGAAAITSRLSDAATEKYPSDDDEVFTEKWPSDDDEPVTEKYPSDDDESFTEKWPSDHEE